MVRIQIEEIIDAVDGLVRFRSAAESVKARWGGAGEVPIGQGLDIEMEISEERIISAVPARRPSQGALAQDGEMVVIVGRAERIGVDGIIEFRVGHDVVLLERVGPLADIVEGTYLELRLSELKIYPLDL